MVTQMLGDINNKAKVKLIELYSRSIEDISDEFIQNAAVDIGNEFGNATETLLNENIQMRLIMLIQLLWRTSN